MTTLTAFASAAPATYRPSNTEPTSMVAMVHNRRVTIRTDPEAGGSRMLVDMSRPLACVFMRERGGQVTSLTVAGRAFHFGPTGYDLAVKTGLEPKGPRPAEGTYVRETPKGEYERVSSPTVPALFEAARELFYASAVDVVRLEARLRELVNVVDPPLVQVEPGRGLAKTQVSPVATTSTTATQPLASGPKSPPDQKPRSRGHEATIKEAPGYKPLTG